MSIGVDSIFEFNSYKEYLRHIETHKIIVSKGFRVLLSRASNCNTPFVSHVLNGHAHFSLEQAFGITKALGLNEDQTQYFLLLIQFERAGTPALQGHFKAQLEGIKERRQVLQARLKGKNKLNLEERVRYYSCWEYSAVHVLVTVEQFQSLQSISKRLSLTEERVAQVINHLIEMNLLEIVNGNYKSTLKQIYLGNDSDLISKHHINWRIKTLGVVNQAKVDENVHYSSVITISNSDAKKIRKMVVDFIAQITPVVHGSKEEDIHSLCMDFFRL